MTHKIHQGIPVSVSLEDTITAAAMPLQSGADKKRIVFISLVAIIIAVLISGIAKALVYLINLVTNIFFHHVISISNGSPATHILGIWVIIVPVIGGILVGLMALYGSKAIRGHGIPEAMEQILTNQSKIRPSITYLKPISSAISIGTGGPFGAEGPIIATGGALGSTIGQLLRISSYERKILLAAGATAGMSAIFGSPIAAIFLAIELLLFEFSPKSIIPVALACITGSAGHHFLFGTSAVFPTPFIAVPGNTALALYSVMGLLLGLLSAGVTKIVYFIEDLFEKLPVHWMWWPAIGGLAVGIIGYFSPRTLGVGYENITEVLSGNSGMKLLLSLCILKFISWAIALGSGTSGGTLAPLLTIGGASGALMAILLQTIFPGCGVTLTLGALVGMSAMFAGASRALLTSIIFALETTEQANALLPLLAACIASYFISFLLLENSIMTEKIARRGIKTPHEYEPDILDKLKVKDVITENRMVISESATIEEARNWLVKRKDQQQNYYIVADDAGVFKGIVSSSSLFSMHQVVSNQIGSLIKRKPLAITNEDSLKLAVEMMARENLDVLPVITTEEKKIAGILSYRDLLSAYRYRGKEHEEAISISLKRRTMKILVHGKKRLSLLRNGQTKA
ncbi:MAG: chloride channel protein [Flavisolibacter sp.]